MRAIIKKIVSPLLQKASAYYLSKPRKYKYKDVWVWVEPTVFPPFLTISTKILLEFSETLSLKEKTFLELGCGCGILSICSAKNGALVTATDINTMALEALTTNASRNEVALEIIESNLFDELQTKTFDFIFINPPYYPKEPKSVAEKAWFCGESFEYFEKLFLQLPKFSNLDNKIYMILSEDCQLQKIKAIALKNAMAFELVFEKKVLGEANFLYQLKKL